MKLSVVQRDRLAYETMVSRTSIERFMRDPKSVSERTRVRLSEAIAKWSNVK